MYNAHPSLRRGTALIAGAILALAASPASATIQFFTGPGSVQPDENVLLNKGTTGLTVFGDTNQSGTGVTFEGLEDLTLPANGQARVEALDGGFQWLSFYLTDPLLAFGEVEFNIDASVDGSGTVTFFDQFGNDFANAITLSGSGQNFFSARGIDGQLITRVLIETGEDMADVQQVRLGPVSAIPEPQVWALMVAGFGLVGWQLRRRRSVTISIA
jgi:hypothetical protein